MRYVIVGGGAAGGACAETLGQLDSAGEITLLSAEDQPGYYRPLLPHLLYDAFPENRYLRPATLFTEARVQVLAGSRATGIDPDKKTVHTDTGQAISYDKLLLSPGSQAIVPPIPGARDMMTLRFLSDVHKITPMAQPGMKALVVGGGRIGIKLALALREVGLEVTVVEMMPHILPLQLDAVAASIVAPAVAARGIRLSTGRQVVEARGGKARLDDGREVDFDLLLAAVGVRPDLELARKVGLKLDQGILVNEFLRTSREDIFAAGDVVQLTDLATGQDFVSGTWTNAVDMGRVAAFNMAGMPRQYPGSFAVQNAVEIAGVATIAVGAIRAPAPGYEEHAHLSNGNYRKFVFRGNRLVGMVLVGVVERAGVYRMLMREGADISLIKEQVLSGTLNYAPFVKPLVPDTGAYTF